MDFTKTLKIALSIVISFILSAILFYIMLLLLSGKDINSNKNISSVCDGSIVAKLEDDNCIENPSLAIKGRPPYKSEYSIINTANINPISKSRCSCYSNKSVTMEDTEEDYSDKILFNGIQIGITEWFCIHTETCQSEVK